MEQVNKEEVRMEEANAVADETSNQGESLGPEVDMDAIKKEELQKFDLRHITQIAHVILNGVAPEVNFHLDLRLEEKELVVEIWIGEESKEHIGLLIGPKWRNITLVKKYLRFQQIVPHERDIKVVINKPDDTQQVTWDHIYSNRK